jgi:hypothetical protein
LEKSTLPNSKPMGGMMMSFTSEVTILLNAAPMMTPIARSMTLPLIANSLNSLSIFISLFTSLPACCLIKTELSMPYP